MLVTRRKFLIGCSAGIATLAGARLSNLCFASESEKAASGDALVLIFLRGGCDGLSLVAPVDDKFYIAARALDLRITDSGESKGLELPKASSEFDFRLPSNASALKELYQQGSLAIIHACGLLDGTRSHFDAMDLMERGVSDHTQKNLPTGWLTRHLMSLSDFKQLPAAAVSSSLPVSLLGSPYAYSLTDLGGFSLYGGEAQAAALAKFYRGESTLCQAARQTLRALNVISSEVKRDDSGNLIPYKPATGSTYPDGELGNNLKTVAQLLKLDLGLKVATIDYGGWDTHEYQSSIMPSHIKELSDGLGAFWNDVSIYHKRLTVVVMSEFGRRLKSNESGGTDHGHGNLMLTLGGNIQGGKVYGKWPGLANEVLDSGADLAVTTDYRTVLSEILLHRLGNSKIEKVFPGFELKNPLGLTGHT